MVVTFSSSHTTGLRHNGIYIQALQTKKYLEEMGVEVRLFSPWDSSSVLKESDIFHIFKADFANYDLARYLNEFDKKFVASSIFYAKYSPKLVRAVSKVEQWAQKHVMKGISVDYGFVREVCSWAEHVLPNTIDEGKYIEQAFDIPSSKISMIPNGVEDRFLQADPELFYKTYGVKDFVLNVGHIGVERKNTLSLLKAMRNIDHPIVVIGRVSNNKEAELCFEEAKKNKNIILIEGLEHDSEMLASAYAASSVFALPAYFETPGIAALEAAITGSEVVITPHGGTKDYFADMAEYVDPYSVDSISKAIEKSLNKESDGKLKQHIVDNFLWQRVAEKTMDIYTSILD